VRAHGNAFLSRGVEDVVFCYLRFPSGKMAHMHLSWLDPHKIRRITVVGNERMAVFDGHGAGPEDHGLRQLANPHGRHLQSDGRRDRSRCGVSASTSCGWSRRGRAHKVARDAVPVVRVLDQLQAALETVPASV